MMTEKMLSAVVACYNDGGSVRLMYERLKKALASVTPHYEIIYVNDASPDNAGEILRELAARDERLTVITHSRNFGSQMAFTSGMTQAIGEAVVLLDGDLQDPPELIPAFAKKWLEGYEVVYGVRVRRRGESRFRQLGYRMFYRLFRRFSYVPIPLDAGDFSLLDRKVYLALAAMPERDRFLRGLRAFVGFRQIGIPYERAARYAGETTNSLLANFRWARRGIFSFFYKPLEYVTYLSMLTALFAGVAIVGYVAAYFLVPNTPKGFLTILVAVLFLGAIQLTSIAVLGEYVSRIFEEVKQRPRFIVKEIVNDHKKSQ